MHIMKVVEKDDGSVTFQGNLVGPELAFVLEIGLETLIKAGAVPFASIDTHEPHDIHEAPEGEQ